jgi:N-acetylmuramoyl-L-alanine amidase
MRELKMVIVHCTDSEWGDKEIIDRWHKDRGWDGIGYHFVIGNCYPTMESHRDQKPQLDFDGKIETGRPLDKVGAHAKGYNENSVGIVLVGKDSFTSRQLDRLGDLIALKFPDLEIKAHREVNDHKTCPNIDPEYLRKMIDTMRI